MASILPLHSAPVIYSFPEEGIMFALATKYIAFAYFLPSAKNTRASLSVNTHRTKHYQYFYVLPALTLIMWHLC